MALRPSRRLACSHIPLRNAICLKAHKLTKVWHGLEQTLMPIALEVTPASIRQQCDSTLSALHHISRHAELLFSPFQWSHGLQPACHFMSPRHVSGVPQCNTSCLPFSYIWEQFLYSSCRHSTGQCRHALAELQRSRCTLLNTLGVMATVRFACGPMQGCAAQQ